MAGDDTLKSGSGNDYIYGGDGEDKIWAGDGNDVLVGQAGDDEFRGDEGNDTLWGGDKDSDLGSADGTDTVDYSGVPAAITITLAASGGAASPTVQDGEGGTDTLHSIEKIEGSSHADTLNVQALTSQVAGTFVHIDLGGGSDTIEISALSGSATVDLRDAQNQTVTFGGAVLKLKNAEHVVGADSGDTIYLSAATAASTIAAGAGDDTIHLAGSGHSMTGGGGYDVLNLSGALTGSRILVDSGAALIRGSGTSAFDGFEEVVGSDGGAFMYGDGRGTRLVAGDGLNYLEGSGADILVGGSGDTYFSLAGGGTVISGAGDDYVDVSGSAPVTIRFGVGSGHDMLASYFGSGIGNDDWIADRQNDMIWLEGLTKDDIELVWDYTAIGYGEIAPDSYDDWYWEGEAAIRIKSTGETLYIGSLFYNVSYYSADFQLFFNGYRSRDYDRMHARKDFNEATGYGSQGNPYWRQYYNNDEDNSESTVELAIFSFDGITRLNIFDLFDLAAVTSQSLPSDVKAASDLFARLAQSGQPVVTGSSGPDTLVGSSGDDDLFGGDGDDAIAGGGGDDSVRAGSGNDVIVGGPGSGSYHGGSGTDGIDFGWSTAGVTVDLLSGFASGPEIGNTRVIDIEDVTGGSGDDHISGNDAVNRLFGGAGTDTLEGGAANDELEGGDGDDVLSGGDGDDQIDGGDGDDHLSGGDGTDWLNGGAGNDSFGESTGLDLMDGGSGADRLVLAGTRADYTYYPQSSGAIVQTADNNHVYVLTSVEWIYFTAEDAAFRPYELIPTIATEDDDLIWGTDGDDVLDGLDGSDYIDGFDGIDTVTFSGISTDYYFARDADWITVGDIFGAGGYDTMVDVELIYFAGDDVLLTIDDIPLPGTEDDDVIVGSDRMDELAGNGGDDTLIGAGGRDYLWGGAGADLMVGGTGDDDYDVDDPGDVVEEDAGAGDDTVLAAIDYALPANVENVILTGAATVAVGNALDNLIWANWSEGSQLHGLGGADTIWGWSGDDLLDGGAGADTLRGGDGADTFAFGAVADSGAAAFDTIQDFVAGVDSIDLGAIDANSSTGADDAFAFVGDAAFTAAGAASAGELRAVLVGGILWQVEGDVDGDGTADLVIQLVMADAQTPSGTDFVV